LDFPNQPRDFSHLFAPCLGSSKLSMRLTPIDRDTLWDRAYATLKAALLEGRFAPGERILLREVADSLGISLTPVRDAVNRLIAERVLERGSVGQGGGATVPLLDAEQFAQLMTVRGSLEPVAAAAAATVASREQLDAVEHCLLEMKQAVAERQPEHYLEAHYRFHFGIYGSCKMPIVQEIIETAWLRCGPTLRLALPEYVPALKRYEFHVAAMNALRQGNGEQAASAIRADIESARQDVCALLEQQATAH
jgi:DNA-binding GntR family transcriptional regulator